MLASAILLHDSVTRLVRATCSLLPRAPAFSLRISARAVPADANWLELCERAAAPVLAPLVTEFAPAPGTGIAAVVRWQRVVVKRHVLSFAVHCALLGVGTIAVGILHG